MTRLKLSKRFKNNFFIERHVNLMLTVAWAEQRHNKKEKPNVWSTVNKTVWLSKVPTVQCCGSGMFIPDPGTWFLPIPNPGSRIPDPKTATNERGEKKLVVIPFFVATNFTKLKIILFLKCWRKKIWANFQRIIELFTQKIVTELSKIWFGIPEPVVKKTPDPGSGSATLLPGTGT